MPLALQPGFEAASGLRLMVDNYAADGLVKRIEAASFLRGDSHAECHELIGKSKVAGESRVAIAKVGSALR